MARPAATIAGASRPGRPAVTAQAPSAATHDSQAKAGRSVWASASWPTRSGVATSAATASPAMAGATRSARRQVHPASTSTSASAGFHSASGTQLRAMPAPHVSATSSVSG